MTTGEILLVAGVAIVGFFVVTKVVNNANTANVNVGPVAPSGSTVGRSTANSLQNIAGRVGGFGGAVVAQATGFGPAAPLFNVAGSSLLRTEVGGFQTAGTGVKELASGNVGTGLKDIAVGGAETAAAPFVSAYSGGKALVSAIGGLL